MFSYFMQECETKVYDIRKKNNISRLKNANKLEIVSACVWIILIIVFICLTIFKGPPRGMYGITIVMVIEFVVVMGWKDREWKKNNLELKNQYQEEVIDKLNPLKNYAYYVMLPFFVAIVVKALDGVDRNTLLLVCSTIFVFQLFFVGTGYMIYPLLNVFFGRKQEFLRRFKEDLLFLSTKW